MNRKPSSIDQERRWNPAAWAAVLFALLIFGYNAGTALNSASLPTDGWSVTGDINVAKPEIFFTTQLVREQSPIQSGDQLLEMNGQTVQTLLDAQHNVFKQNRPDLPDGTILTYKVLRSGMPISLEVPIRRLPYWRFFPAIGDLKLANITQLAGSLFFFIAGLIVFLLRPGNRAAHALLFIGVGFFFNAVPGNSTAPTLFYPSTPVSIPFDTWTLAINPSLMYLALVFPQPKLPVRRFPRLGVLLLYLPWPLAFNLAYLLNLDDRLGYLQAAFAIYPVQVIIMMVVTLGSLIHSAITLRDPVGRSQFKWMLVGISSFVFMGVGGWLVSAYLFPGSMGEGNWLLTTIGWFLLPICLAISITRYRLFDIDVIIRRTLQYSILTGLLALIYFGSVVLGQQLTAALTGSAVSPLVVVVSTLLMAALFNPLRVRVQAFIDRRFYRRKYDALQTLAAFTQTARDETRLEALVPALLGAVQDSLQPEQAWLWLKPPGGKG